MEDILAESVLQLVKSSNGIKASHIAKHLKVSRKEINKILYGNLSNCCFRDEKYLWYVLGDAISISKPSEDCMEKLEKKFSGIDFTAEDLEMFLNNAERQYQ